MKVSVVVLTWRPGGFDCFTSALAKQVVDVPFEVIIVDELYRWRAPLIAERLAAYPFPVKHVPTDDTLFPVASTMRAGNTALRHATGDLIVHVCDHALPPPDFLQKHVDLYRRTGGKSVGIANYRMRKVDPKHWAWQGEPLQVWDMIEQLCRDRFREEFLWSILTAPPVEVLAACEEHDGWAGSGLLGMASGTPGNEWSVHYKTDSVPMAAYKAVNGWDEEYDGAYAYADVDMTLRLAAAGYPAEVVDVEVEILDAHAPVKRVVSATFRDYDAPPLLSRTRIAVAEGRFVCDYGLTLTENADRRRLIKAPIEGQTLQRLAVVAGVFPKWKVGDTTTLTIARPWLSGPTKTLTIRALPEDAFAWKFLEPKVGIVGKDNGRVCDMLPDDARRFATADSLVMNGPFNTVITTGSVEDFLRVTPSAKKWSIFTGTEKEVDEAEAQIHMPRIRNRPGEGSMQCHGIAVRV